LLSNLDTELGGERPSYYFDLVFQKYALRFMSVLVFPSRASEECADIPTPLYHRPEDRVSTIELQHDMAGFPKGCVFYLKHGRVFKGCTHFVRYRGEGHFGYITDFGPLSFRWHGFNPAMPNGVYRWTEAEVVGAITEIWSFGLGEGRPRWAFDESRVAWGNSEHLERILEASAAT
jgi:hypothetical protein